MKTALLTLCLAASALPLAACDGGYGYGVGGYPADGPYAFDGFYDDFYGPIYDGYWGNDDRFYYRRGPGDRHFHRGGRGHFFHSGPGGRRFHHFGGTFHPGPGMHMPHFGGHGAHGHHGGHR